MRRIYYLLGLVAVTAIIILDSSRRPPVSEYKRTPSHAIAYTEDSALRQAIAPEIAAHPGLSGFHLITHGKDALLVRIALIEAAQRSLDIQYYSVQDDETGKLLLEAILRAADRGVRVRMLIDDIALKKTDATWALLDTHPHIELRIFNPFATEDQSYLSRIGHIIDETEHFSKRMHNKAFIADNQLSLIGGRNLGDAYFDSSQDFNFRDVDALSVGPITPEVSQSFDHFWNGDEAYPINALVSISNHALAKANMRQTLEEHWQDAVQKGILANTPTIIAQLKNGTLPLIWAEAELAADSPKKIDKPKGDANSAPGNRLDDMVNHAQHEFVAISPYFVPGEDGVQWLKGIVHKGIKVSILTNSLASTDVVAVHAGYRRYREAVIRDGIELYEMKPLPGKRPPSGRFSSSSRASLHTKVFVIDRSDVIIGTMNMDPRSVQLNTEIALIIHSPPLAGQVAGIFEKAITPGYSYHVVEKDSHLEWIGTDDDHEVRYQSDPKAGFWRSVETDLYALLPFEDQL